jgi:hypothetical protein
VRGNSWNSHKDKEFGQKLFHPFAEGLLRCRRLHVELAKRPETLFKSMLLRCSRLVLLTRRQARIRSLGCAGDRLLIQVFDSFGPPSQLFVVGVRFFEIVDIA